MHPRHRLIGLQIFVAAGHASAGSPPAFVEHAAEAGITASHATVSNQPDREFQNAGGAVGDFDRDGDQDLFVIGGSAGVDRLYLNDGSGHFTDVSAAAGISRTHRGSGACVGDYDRDGDLDIYVTSIGTAAAEATGANILYRNNGDGTFTDVTNLSGVRYNNQFLGDAYSASFGDYDLDGDLDLAVAGWLGGNQLFRNNGNGTFINVTPYLMPEGMGTVRGFTPRFVDMNNDRYPELLWVGDFGTSRYLINHAGVFTNDTAAAGTGMESNGMGNTFADFDGDGTLDWYVTSRINPSMTDGSGNLLYLQGQPDSFAEVSAMHGANFGYWGWGTDAQDFDHDRDVDIVATNGFDGTQSNDPTCFFLNDGTGHFTEAAAAVGVTDTGQGRGLLTADLDNDGDRDIVIFNNRQPLLIYRNDLPGAGSNAITVFLDTKGVAGVAPDGVGSLVTAATAYGTQRRYLDGGSNYLAQSELSCHFGLGDAPSAGITIAYPDGLVVSYPNVAPGRYTITRLTCPGDLTRDGLLNFFDITRFIGFYNAHHPMADVTHDGLFNFFDISGYIGSYNAGCP